MVSFEDMFVYFFLGLFVVAIVVLKFAAPTQEGPDEIEASGSAEEPMS